MKKGEAGFLLDAYFPFDPYVLPKSKRWLAQDYVQWKPIPGMEPVGGQVDEEEEDDDDGEDEEDDSESDMEREVDRIGVILDDATDSST